MKMKKILTSFFFGFLVLLYVLSYAANFKLVGDVLDNFGGRASSTNFSLRISSGGQPSPVTKMASTSFKDFSGYVPEVSFWHGDCNGDGSINMADVVCLSKYVMGGGCALRPVESGAVNDIRAVCDNQISIADVIYLANYLMKSGPSPCNL